MWEALFLIFVGLELAKNDLKSLAYGAGASKAVLFTSELMLAPFCMLGVGADVNGQLAEIITWRLFNSLEH